jgi:D-galactarolactone cycloisomerase
MHKISRIEIVSLEITMPPGKAYGNARGLNFKRGCSIVSVTTDDGVVGYGEALGPPFVLREYLEMATPSFIGRRIFDFEIVAAEINNRLYHFGGQNHMTAALSGVSVALYDAMGKTLGVPVHDLLGGRAVDRLSCYATTGYITANPEHDLEEQLAKIDKRQFAGVKIKIGIGPKSDLARVQTARRILGDDILLMVDINGNYTTDIALESMRLIEPYNIHWCEEPLPPNDVRGYTELRARSPIRLAAGEALATAANFKRMVEVGALDILQPAVASCGGYGQAKTIAQLAELHNLRVVPSTWGGAICLAQALHFAASIPISPHSENVPYPIVVEYDASENPLRDDLLTSPIVIEDGKLVVPQGPGLGIGLNEETVKRYRV